MSPGQRTTFRVRPAIPADSSEIWSVHVRSIREVCVHDYTLEQIEAWARPKRPDDYVRALANGERMWVAEDESGLLGFACLSGNELRGLYVAPTSQRRGIGSALLRALETDAAQQGVTRLTLQSTLNAVAFYEARGFRAGEPVSRQMGNIDVPCVPMEKSLGAIKH